MKKITLFLLLTLVTKTAFADCGMSAMHFFPATKEISLNSKFIIQGYAYSQKTINSFKNREVYLESGSGELIELNLEEFYIGQMQLTQAIFCPTSELKPNTKYFLKYSDQTENEEREMKQYNRGKKVREKVYWKTTNKKELETLNSNLNIEFEKTEVIHYGCGPSVNAIFNIKNRSKSEIWYKTEVIDLTTNNKKVFYIKEWNGKLNVGHGMCAGAFTYKNEGKYKVRFTPMNTDGKSLKTTDWTTFESPFKNDEIPFGN
ncbi:hypothetical protein [Seonamhaeicola marinus]|uniref:Uncharacterized protein n=1 Tax=Seonamhaeicola marinus TaxID=1912246 RepID=A0A5D0IM34_9FLAO|nr:hypothetical protein [Seonamhaeicola marinus]TYA84238.1 hypothetical protein FUA24_06200 [Seonamhaeicola marinus]